MFNRGTIIRTVITCRPRLTLKKTQKYFSLLDRQAAKNFIIFGFYGRKEKGIIANL